MGDGHDCTCAEPIRIETSDRVVCAECGGTMRGDYALPEEGKGEDEEPHL